MNGLININNKIIYRYLINKKYKKINSNNIYNKIAKYILFKLQYIMC